jgi:hypothetical protein
MSPRPPTEAALLILQFLTRFMVRQPVPLCGHPQQGLPLIAVGRVPSMAPAFPGAFSVFF